MIKTLNIRPKSSNSHFMTAYYIVQGMRIARNGIVITSMTSHNITIQSSDVTVLQRAIDYMLSEGLDLYYTLS